MATMKDLQSVANEWLDRYARLRTPDESDERDVLECLEEHQAVIGTAHYLATELLSLKADEKPADPNPDIVQDDPDTQRIEQAMWDTARAYSQMQADEDEQQPTPPAPPPAVPDKQQISDALDRAWREARDFEQLSHYQDEAAPHAYAAFDGLIDAVRYILKRL